MYLLFGHDLICSTKQSSILNLIMTVFHVVFFGFIIIAGFYKGSGKNLVRPGGLAPFGVKGVLKGAAKVYFSYIGYDSVSTMAEEIQNPSKSLPVGIVGSMLIVSLLYCLMALSLCIMVPYNEVSLLKREQSIQKLDGLSILHIALVKEGIKLPRHSLNSGILCKLAPLVYVLFTF